MEGAYIRDLTISTSEFRIAKGKSLLKVLLITNFTQKLQHQSDRLHRFQRIRACFISKIGKHLKEKKKETNDKAKLQRSRVPQFPVNLKIFWKMSLLNSCGSETKTIMKVKVIHQMTTTLTWAREKIH